MFDKTHLIKKDDALSGRDQCVVISNRHYVNGNILYGNFDGGLEKIVVGMGCFWGAERLFWKIKGVYSTSVGYCGGYTKNPTYEEVCSRKTGHAEVVRVVFDPKIISFEKIIKIFFENHNPTEYMRQGNDIGSQYRSVIFTSNDIQYDVANKIAIDFESKLIDNGFDKIKTQIEMVGDYFFAEEYHQQYLAKNTNGYCGLKGTGVSCL